MKIKYSVLAILLGAAYMLLTQVWPDFPLSADMLLTLVLYILFKLGVEIVDAPVRGLVQRAKLSVTARFKK